MYIVYMYMYMYTIYWEIILQHKLSRFTSAYDIEYFLYRLF